jgi:transketolase
MKSLVDPRIAFAHTLVELARADERVCVVVNDSLSSSNATEFLDLFPDRLFDAGIAEQNMVGMAAGLANAGMVPFVCAASCFLTGRALEQIKVDIALSKANVKLCGFSPGFAYGSLGATHHSIEDLAWIRILPNIKVAAPSDAHETSAALVASYTHVGPCFLRVNRLPVPGLTSPEQPFEFGKAHRMREGNDVTLIGAGFTVHRAVEAANLLAREGIECRVINMSSIKPLDTVELIAAATDTRRIVCIEDHLTEGGLFSAVAGQIVRHEPVPMLAIGVPGIFAPVGNVNDLLGFFGLESQQIARNVQAWLAELRYETKKELYV